MTLAAWQGDPPTPRRRQEILYALLAAYVRPVPRGWRIFGSIDGGVLLVRAVRLSGGRWRT